MEFFCSEEAVKALEIELEQARGTTRLPIIVQLAWQLRQRDTARAKRLAEEVLSELGDVPPVDRTRVQAKARLTLTLGYVHSLHCDIDESLFCADAALRLFETLDDRVGCSDAHSLRAANASLQGNSGARIAALESAYRAALGCDADRAVALWADVTRETVFVKSQPDGDIPKKARALLLEHTNPHVLVSIKTLLVVHFSASGDFVECIKEGIEAHTLAVNCGNMVVAIMSSSNVGTAFEKLGDFKSALYWKQCAVTLSRPRGWPQPLGAALSQYAGTLNQLGRIEEAGALLEESLAVMGKVQGSRSYLIALHFQACVHMTCNQFAQALTTHRLLEEQGEKYCQADLVTQSQIGQARVLIKLNQPEHAMEKLNLAMSRAQSSSSDQVDCLTLMAEARALQLTGEANHAGQAPTPLQFLEQAIGLATTIPEYRVHPKLLQAFASEHARLGDHAQAYSYANLALERHKAVYSQATLDLTRAMQVDHQIRRTQAQADHQSVLRSEQERRVTELLVVNTKLEALSKLGLKIAGKLTSHDVLTTIFQTIPALMDMTAMVYFSVGDDGQSLLLQFGIRDGKAVDLLQVGIDHPYCSFALCARERRELLVDDQDAGSAVNGSQLPRSKIYAPLLAEERLLGVLSVQSVNCNAYGDHERAIFRTLCAYAAIALENVAAYRLAHIAQEDATQSKHALQYEVLERRRSNNHLWESIHELEHKIALKSQEFDAATTSLQTTITELRETERMLHATRDEMIQAGKLTMLGQMSAGITHELSQPLTAIRAFADNAVILLRRGEAEQVRLNLSHISSAGQRMGSILGQLKGLASKGSDTGVPVELAKSINNATLLMQSDLCRGNIELELDLDDELIVIGKAGRIEQVLVNLLRNALDAVETVNTKRIRVQLIRDGEAAIVRVQDTGTGIAKEAQARLFEPFFTTKPLGKGLGLGLAISQAIIRIMDGNLTARNREGGGAEFELRMPAVQ